MFSPKSKWKKKEKENKSQQKNKQNTQVLFYESEHLKGEWTKLMQW